MSTEHTDWNRTDLIFSLVCACFLYLQLFVLPTTPIFYEEDHLYFIQDAWRMYRGEALYRDFFEYTFPGTQALYFLLLNVFGTKFWIINLVVFAQGLIHAILGLSISKVLFGNRWYAYLPPSLFLFFGFRWFGIDGSHRMLSPIFIYLAVLILCSGRTWQRIVLAGVCCALSSYFTQQRGILAVSAIAVFLLIEAIRSRSGWKKWLADEFTLGGSFAISLFILVLPFVISAGPSRFFEYTIAYIAYYVQDPTANYGAYQLLFEKTLQQGLLMSGIMFFYYALIPLVYFVGFFYLWRKKFQVEALLICLVGFFLALGTFAPTPGRLFQICLPALIVFVWLLFQIKFKSDVPVKFAVVLLGVFGMGLAVRTQASWERHYLDSPSGRIVFPSATTFERYKWLSENARPGEAVFEVYQTAVNFPLQLPNPTRVTFLLDHGYTPDWLVQQAVEDLEQKQPRFIIWDGKWNKEPWERNPDDHLASMYEYLQRNYRLEKAFTPYSNREMQVWKIKTDE